MAKPNPSLIWFQRDLRLQDNPALCAAAAHPLIAIYIWDEHDPWNPGRNGYSWLTKSLMELEKNLQKYNIQLILRKGNPIEILKTLIQETDCCALYWNRCYEPYTIQRNQNIENYFKNKGIQCESFKASLLVEPWELKTKEEKAYKIFSPFWQTLQKLSFRVPLAQPPLQGWDQRIISESLKDWYPDSPTWGKDYEETLAIGEDRALKKLETFLNHELVKYAKKSNFPFENVTSRLSPYLHWGEISPYQIWHAAVRLCGEMAFPFLRELAWREFSYQSLYHFPELPSKPMRSAFETFPWETDYSLLELWQKGVTGYPIVDAGMRELWHTGWIPNRIRLIVASFLVKDLLLPWQMGEAWFWDMLVDADLGNNALNWQWVAGCGIDSAPYFRIFNPVLQSEKYDPQGLYIKKWVPELKTLNTPYIHSPWSTPPKVLKESNVILGETYPYPVVNHNTARQRALEAYNFIQTLK